MNKFYAALSLVIGFASAVLAVNTLELRRIIREQFISTTAVSSTDPSLSLGFIATLSGPRSSLGTDALDGAHLALDHLKRRGISISLNVEDSRGEPLAGVNAYKKLRSQNLPLVLTQNSNVSLPISQLVNQDRIVQLAFNTTADSYSRANDLTFRINGSTFDEARVIAVAVAGICAGTKPVAIITMEDEYPINLSRNLRQQLRGLGISIKYEETFLPRESDFHPLLLRLKNKDIACIALLSYQSEAGFFVKQKDELQFAPALLIGNTPVNNREFFDIAGPHAEGVVVSYHRTLDGLPAAAEFERRYGRRLNWFSANGYDAVMLAGQVLSACLPDSDTLCLAQQIQQTRHYRGLSGVKNADSKFGDMQDSYALLVAKNGKFVPRD